MRQNLQPLLFDSLTVTKLVVTEVLISSNKSGLRSLQALQGPCCFIPTFFTTRGILGRLTFVDVFDEGRCFGILSLQCGC
jgi:hypothetical protein